MSFFDDIYDESFGGQVMTSSNDTQSGGGFLSGSVLPKLEYTFERGLDYYLDSLWRDESSLGIYDGYAERYQPVNATPVEPGIVSVQQNNLVTVALLVGAGLLAYKLVS